MLTGPQLRAFRKSLLGWFREFQRDLPWRANRDAYRVWLSEIMLQQTRVAAVIPYYERFLQRFPTVRTLAEAPTDEVLRLWSGLGYYSRARNLQQAARQITTEHHGKFPESSAAVLALPGIGAYTAAAILSIAFDQKFAVLDGNVARVVARLFAMRGELREPQRWRALQEHADELLDQQSPGDWNQAVMELGATICTPRSPQCLLCPAANFCAARKLGVQEEIPEKRKKRAPVRVQLAAAIFVDRQQRTLLLPPPKAGDETIGADHVPTLVSRMLHFPIVAVAEEPEAELKKFLKKQLRLANRTKLPIIALARIRHSVTYRQITVFPFRIDVEKLPATPQAQCVKLGEVTGLSISNLTRKIARAGVASMKDGPYWPFAITHNR